ncbi:MFS transporter [Paenibacillus arenilitoris]|uniref:MFS transporter n=1 Tax=Paenibacillus arenilitoris TaxID=2772299 RepID=A0A927CSN4_9BACL|nr:MFS transporter [Paenibacillus arenilitoris]MBD2870880.1 MFS transporter [Paenibacillus arenilitoris]
MQNWKRTMWILWVGVLLCSSSYTMAVPFLPLFLFDLGVGQSSVNLWAGIVHSSAFLVGAVMAPFWGSMADKYGKRKMVIRAGISLAIIYSLISVVQTPWQLIVVRMLHGFVGGFVPASMAIVATVAPANKMGQSLGIMQAGTMTGGILGPFFGGLLATAFGLRMSFVVSGAIIFLATIAVIFWVKEGHSRGEAKKSTYWGNLKYAFTNATLRNLLLLLLIFQISYNMIQPLLTLHIADLQGNVRDAVLTSGYVISLIGIAGIIASPLWGRAGERLGHMRMLAFCMAGAGLVVCFQYFVDRLWLFTFVQFVFGLFIAGIAPTVNTLFVKSTPEEFRGRSFGMTASANQLGSMIGPLIGGVLGLYLSIHWIFVTSGLILAAAGLSVMAGRPAKKGMPERQ